MHKILYVFIVVVVWSISSTIALARYEDRSGINFGTTIKILSNIDSNKDSDENISNSKVNSKSSAVHPYVGYAFAEFFNVGLTVGYENYFSVKTYLNKISAQKISLTTQTQIKSVSLYSRFMFADYFYFESGLGIYQQKLSIINEFTFTNGTGVFSGEKEEYSSTGIGLGWHFGGGIEIPIINGFYVNTNYIVRAIEIHDFKNNSEIGPRKGVSQSQELNFGIVYYLGI